MYEIHRAKVADSLSSLLDLDQFSDDPKVLDYYAQDAYWPGRALAAAIPPDTRPQAVVWPRSTDDVARLLRWASQEKVAIIPWGGGTGVMGAAIPWRGGIVLDLSRFMNRILAIDPESQTATVQAGIILGELDAAAQAHGLIVGHDPYSQPIATVGGAISTSGMGWSAGRYGPMVDQVLAVEAVLGDGTVIRTRPVVKAAGPPLHRLFAGAEGTLGILTEVTLRLFPRPEHRVYHAFTFPTFEAGFRAVSAMWALGLRPALLDYGAESDWDPEPDSPFAPPLEDEPSSLNLVFEGFREEVEASEKRALELCRSFGGRGQSVKEARRYWEQRHRSADRFRERRAAGARGWGYVPTRQRSEYIHVALPVSAVLEYHRECHALAQEHQVHLRECAVWTHPGLFSYILALEAETPEAAAERMRIVADLFLQRAQDRGGSMEYTHGIGLRLVHLAAREFGPAGELLKRLKNVMDPAGVLNPGKLGL